MNRQYTKEHYLELVDKIRKTIPDISITTDIIAGFPQETDEDFDITKAFLEKVHFYEMHIFKYSRRKGTVADKMADQVDDRVKTVRSNELIQLEEKMSFEYRKLYEKSCMNVLIEEKQLVDGKEYYTGYTMNYIRVLVPAKQLENGNECIVNNIYKVNCLGLDTSGKYMYGEVVCDY